MLNQLTIEIISEISVKGSEDLEVKIPPLNQEEKLSVENRVLVYMGLSMFLNKEMNIQRSKIEEVDLISAYKRIKKAGPFKLAFKGDFENDSVVWKISKVKEFEALPAASKAICFASCAHYINVVSEKLTRELQCS